VSIISDKQNKTKVEIKQQKMYIITIDYTILIQLLNDKYTSIKYPFIKRMCKKRWFSVGNKL